MFNLQSTPIDKVEQQEEFVKAIAFQLEVASNAFLEAQRYRIYLNERYNTELNHLNKLKEQQ